LKEEYEKYTDQKYSVKESDEDFTDKESDIDN
jgi:hypothetical protein